MSSDRCSWETYLHIFLTFALFLYLYFSSIHFFIYLFQGELAAEYILEHSSRVSPDPDGFKNTMKDIVNSHLRSRINVILKHFQRHECIMREIMVEIDQNPFRGTFQNVTGRREYRCDWIVFRDGSASCEARRNLQQRDSQYGSDRRPRSQSGSKYRYLHRGCAVHFYKYSVVRRLNCEISFQVLKHVGKFRKRKKRIICCQDDQKRFWNPNPERICYFAIVKRVCAFALFCFWKII